MKYDIHFELGTQQHIVSQDSDQAWKTSWIGGEAFWNQSVLNFPTVNTAPFEPPERRNIRDCRDKTGTQFLDCDYQVVVCQNSL